MNSLSLVVCFVILVLSSAVQAANTSDSTRSYQMDDYECNPDGYLEYLSTLDFNYLISEFRRVAEEVRSITKFEGEPEIVLMVYEPKTCICAERPVLQQYFKENGIVVEEWSV